MSQSPSSGDAPSDPAFAALEPGFLVGNGRFTLVRLIGRGGMGVVWLARDESLREDVALKFLPHEIRFDAVALDDLRRETARARKLTHSNIIRIHDLYKDDRETFISMEYIDGPNLSDLRLEKPDRVFTWEYLEPLVKQLCEAMDYAHIEKVIHRDLKPANMMLDSRGRLKLSDFGIAAQMSDSVSRVSMIRHGQSGTLTHMSPQQMDGKLPQVSDDIYALGATLYELLTSRAPFFTGDIPYQVRNLLPQPIDERLAELGIENEVPRPVAAMIMACLGKSPEQRPTSARAVAEWIGFQPTSATAISATPVAANTTATEISTEPLPPPKRPATKLKAEPIQPPEPVQTWTEADASDTEPDPITGGAKYSSRWVKPTAIAACVLFVLGLGVFAWWLVTRNAGRSVTTNLSATDFLRSEHIFTDHSGPVNSVAFSPNQRFLASGSADGSIAVRELERGEIQWRANAEIGAVNAVSVSRESRLLAVAGAKGIVKLFDIRSGKTVFTLRMHNAPVGAAVFSPTVSQLASAAEDGSVVLWDYEKGTRVKQWKAQASAVRALAYSANGNWLASGAHDSSVRVWDLASGSIVKAVMGHKGEVWSVAFSPDGRWLVSSSHDRTLRIWETTAAASREVLRWRADVNLMYGVGFSPDSKFLLVGFRQGVGVYPANSIGRGKERRFDGHAGPVRSVAFSPDGRAFASASDDHSVRLWPFSATATGNVAPTADATASEPSDIAGQPLEPADDVAASRITDSGFVELFNGRDLVGWVRDGKVWSVRNGVIHGETGRRKIATCLFWNGEEFTDFELRFRYRLVRGNSGVFYRAKQLKDLAAGGYQFDIATTITGNLIDAGEDRQRRDLFRVDSATARRIDAAGTDSWHEVAIIASGQRLVHRIDGALVCDLQDVFQRRPGNGLIGFEAHSHTTVEFKDIRIRRMAETAVPVTMPNALEWVALFDGRSLAAWQGWNGADWRGSWEILNGELRSRPGGNLALVTREQFADFELEWEWKVTRGGNSGVFYRAPQAGSLQKTSPEYQLVDDATRDGRNPITAAGSVYGVVPPLSNKELEPVGSFNQSRIVMRGSQAEHWLNGVRILDVDLASPAVQKIATQKFGSAFNKSAQGHIVLQNTGTEASFRNLRVRKLN